MLEFLCKILKSCELNSMFHTLYFLIFEFFEKLGRPEPGSGVKIKSFSGSKIMNAYTGLLDTGS